MNITVDTNILVRSIVRDDRVIAVALPCLCEFAGVLLTCEGFSCT